MRSSLRTVCRISLVCFIAAIFLPIGSVSAQLSDSERQEQFIFNGQVSVGPGRQHQISFATRTNFRNGRIAGSVQARGGSGNDIRVMVVKDRKVVFDSGQKRSVVVSVDISEPGQYTLVFDNSFSLLSSKTVAGRISFVNWGVDVEKNAAENAQAQDRYRSAVAILARIYEALKMDERVWGTSQMFAQPRITINNDRTINAAAMPNNIIGINRGFFDFTDTVGERGEDVLAAVLAHELSHLFFRHPGYGTGQGLKSIFDELRGVSALDRAQEQEADVLGTRLMCQAGFDPQGVLILMTKFIEMDPTASNFARTHPIGKDRYKYLQGEVLKCEMSRPKISKTESAMKKEPTVSPTPASSQNLWRLAQDPNSRWKIWVEEDFLFAERIMSSGQSAAGDFDTIEARKKDDQFSGTQHMRATVSLGRAGTQAGTKSNTCTWDFAVQISSISASRIEGKWEGYPRDTQLDTRQCKFSGERVWEDFTFIPAE